MERGDIAGLFLSLLPLILIFFIFYFLVFLPQHKKTKEHKNMINSLKLGDYVSTVAGIQGMIVEIKENTVVLKIKPSDIKIEFTKDAISEKINIIPAKESKEKKRKIKKKEDKK